MKMPRVKTFRPILVFILFAFLGIAVTPYLDIKLHPDDSKRKIFVSYQMPGVSALEVENSVTSRLEGIIAALKGVEEIESVSRMGGGQINITLDRYSEPENFRVSLVMAIRQAWHHFPKEVSYPIVSTNSIGLIHEKALMTFRVESYSEMGSFHEILTQKLIPQLHKIKGLNRVQPEGLFQHEVHIVLDKQKTQVLDLSANEIAMAIRNYGQSVEISSAKLLESDEYSEYTLSLSFGKLSHINLDEIVILEKDEKIIKLSDVASYEIHRSNENQIFRINGVDNVYLRFYAEKGVNHLKLAKSIYLQLKEFAADYEKELGVFLVSDSTRFISAELQSIAYRSLITLILLILASWLVYRSKIYVAIIAISLAINVCISLFVFYLYGIEIHFFALAGITISLGMMIDNSIIVIDYLKNAGKSSIRVMILIPLLAANLTTIGSLLAIGFFSFQDYNFWHDFIAAVVICLTLSFISSLFLIPSLARAMGLSNGKVSHSLAPRTVVAINQLYGKYIHWAVQKKWLVILIFSFVFGTPIFLLPDEVESNKAWGKVYNKIFKNTFFALNIRPYVDKFTGGLLRVFVEDIMPAYKVVIPQEKQIVIFARAQQEYTNQSLNRQIRLLEQYLIAIDEIHIIQLELTPNKQANIILTFDDRTYPLVPYQIMDELADYLKKHGGGSDWSLSYKELNLQVIHGIKVNQTWGFNLYGYRFNELLNHAISIKNELEENPRIINVNVKSRFSFFNNQDREVKTLFSFYQDVPLATRQHVLNRINELSQTPINLGNYEFGGTIMSHYLKRPDEIYNYFNFFNTIQKFGDTHNRLAYIGETRSVEVPLEIVRKDQQYQLYMNFGYMGSAQMALDFEKEQIQKFNSKNIPGFFAESKTLDNTPEKPNLLLLILSILLVVFFITSILFESFKQAIWVVIMIPFSYIGVFLTFWVFEMHFDQGGYAAMILLGGISVNASLYLLNAFNNVSNRKSIVKKYLEAWRTMITPILLTIFSTILGFIPWLIKGSEVFWKTLATGMIGGLVFSLLVIIFVLPLSIPRDKL